MALVKYNNNSISAVTSAAAIPSGAMTHIKTLTASSSSTLSFVHGSSDVVLDSTYPIYLFKLINIHSSNNDVLFSVGFRDGGSAYDATKTTTLFQGKEYLSATSIGNNPTFNGSKRSIETYIIDFNQNIYGENIRIIFKDFIRSQIKFSKIEELKSQMMDDINYILNIKE